MTVPGIEEFTELTGRYRPELLAHCYRMLGSPHEAEDLVQETYLRAWRYYDRFEGRSSVRLWLYQIATSVCLNAIRTRKRRPLPSGLGAPAETATGTLAPAGPDVPWRQPAPDSLFTGSTGGPATVVARRDGLRLAFVAALQHLSARQRAVLILRDVLGWSANEVAEILDTTGTAVHSALQRARSRLADVSPSEDDLAEPPAPELRKLLDRYVSAFERADVAALAGLLRLDVELEMPPVPTWFTGRAAVTEFLAGAVLHTPGSLRLIPARANASPAFAVYARADDGSFRPYGVQVLSLIGGRVARVSAFIDPGLVTVFGLPDSLGARPAGRA
ncbi:sigma-70 family RNA polymerase sigma factor [Amycolatopsis australiensis]|uniref:RNA polymerase, sigma subunit, ECF family n=1 Tax=Amycolatopsis australiensis TaxID=546364 RepID=A0A1K1S350_9PSEU|nr:sigma-70 family RNA polymerase sigma factor [Amycolatopsis australiensis]SFW78795.1 RNA polymerase, sigma subunit, ECF family [Amycolatopsis australiensis]